MEARIARLESDVAHLRTAMADVKVDVRALRDKIERMGLRLDGKLDKLNDKLEARFQTLQESIASAKIWALALYIAFGATVLGTMARGFNWL